MTKKPVIRNLNDLLDSSLVNHADTNMKLLPLTHIPDPILLPVITVEGELKGREENNFYETEELIFFSYGRNYYMPSHEREKAGVTLNPFLLVYKFEDLKSFKMKRILPFDSGGFKYYDIDKNISPKNFEVSNPEENHLQKLTFLLFGSTESYMKLEHTDFSKLIRKLPFFKQIKHLHNLYETQRRTTTRIGKQARSFEVQYEKSIPLRPVVVFVEDEFYDDDDSRTQIETEFPTAQILPYKKDINPDVNLHLLNDALKEYIEKDYQICCS